VTVGLAIVVAAISACGSTTASHTPAARSDRTALISYLRQVEPIRLAVNQLLEKADPILLGSRRARLSSTEAARLMNELERQFAAYTVAIASIEPDTQALRKLQDAYAGTYILEDAYLSALVSGLERELGNLPNTQAAQRATIIQWRTQLTVLARRVGVTLPTDLQQAGRGEVAPSPGGS
jgi:hypothetical protein